MNLIINNKFGIVSRLIIYMMLFSTVVTLLITGIQFKFNYSSDLKLIDDNLQQIKEIYLRTLINSVWMSNSEQLRIVTEGLYQLRNVQYIEVRDESKILIRYGEKIKNNIVIREYPMIHNYRNKKITIGLLTVIVSLDSVYQRLIKKSWVILIINAIEIFLVSIFMLIMFYKLNTRHLVHIANFAKGLNTINFDKSLILNRKNRENNSKDELDLVVDAINKMQVNIKNSFNALVKSEKRFQVLAKVSPVGVFHADKQGDCTYVNDSWCKMADISFNDALGVGWFSAIHPDDRDRVFKDWYENIRNATRFKSEFRFLCDDGKITWLYVQLDSIFDEYNELTGFVGAATDITDRKRLENVLQSLAIGSVEDHFDLFISKSLGHLIEFFNCEYAFIGEILPDKKSVKTLAVQSVNSFLENSTFLLNGTAFEEVFYKKRKFIVSDVIKLYPNDPLIIDMQAESYFGSQLTSSSGEVIGILAVLDIHQLKFESWMDPVLDLFAAKMSLELEREMATQDTKEHQVQLEYLVDIRTNELVTALEQAQHANDAKSEFLSRMSHELRTPLNAILGFAQIIQLDSDKLDEGQKDNLNEILAAGDHLLKLINEVLDLAKIESGKLEITMQDVCVSDVINQSLSLVTNAALYKDIELIDNIADKNYIVIADVIRLKQVILNILSNAVKYNHEHGKIIIDSELLDNNRIRIRITDNGAGLSEQDIEKLFTSFERLDAINNVEGTGIGLVITKHLMELMGGAIGVESIVNEGSTFYIDLELSNDNVD